ncbi:MAG: hypothetical protein AAGC88_13790, partial [Bacteroidota bacterium]
MSKAVRKIAFILIGIVMVPILLYTALQVDQLEDTEEMMWEIYERQMNAILFSINQYSNDVVTGLAKQLEYLDPIDQTDSTLNEFLTYHKEVTAIHMEEVETGQLVWLSREAGASFEDVTNTPWVNYVDMKDRLVRYKKANFMKIEPLGKISDASEVYGMA